jgi:hypothetical protein
MSGNTEAHAESEARGLETVREHRGELEALAETDLPAASIAEALLEAVDGDKGKYR